MLRNLSEQVLWTIGGIFGVLILATIIVVILRKLHPDKRHDELVQRVKTWWTMVAVFVLALALSKKVSLIFLAFVSFLALKEYLSMIPTRRADRRVLFWAYLAIPVQYYWVHDEWYGMFLIFIPIYMFLLLPVRMVLIGNTEGFLSAAGKLHWGMMTTVYSLSHTAYLLIRKSPEGELIGPGLVMMLVVLTQANDVMQYCFGKLLGKRKIVPTVSPNKTWEGFLGGLGSTIVLAMLLGPYLTPLSLQESAWAGAIIGLAGFFGDVVISAIKRDIGVKDTGSLLPGHGGILDRVDSMTYTSPLFFHYSIWILAKGAAHVG